MQILSLINFTEMAIFKSSFDVLNHIKDKYPNAKLVPVCMGQTAHNVYSDDTYEKQIGELQYHYNTSGTSMFGYDYKFVKTKLY